MNKIWVRHFVAEIDRKDISIDVEATLEDCECNAVATVLRVNGKDKKQGKHLILTDEERSRIEESFIQWEKQDAWERSYAEWLDSK